VDSDENDRFVAGIAYDLGHHNTFLLDYDKVVYEGDHPDDDRIQLTLQIKY
jgi:hypothetical protein